MWEALADLFLDTTLDDADRRFIAWPCGKLSGK